MTTSRNVPRGRPPDDQRRVDVIRAVLLEAARQNLLVLSKRSPSRYRRGLTAPKLKRGGIFEVAARTKYWARGADYTSISPAQVERIYRESADWIFREALESISSEIGTGIDARHAALAQHLAADVQRINANFQIESDASEAGRRRVAEWARRFDALKGPTE